MCNSLQDLYYAMGEKKAHQADAEAAEAERQRAREAQHNRLMELHTQILRRVRDAYAVKANDYSTFEFQGYRYEI